MWNDNLLGAGDGNCWPVWQCSARCSSVVLHEGSLIVQRAAIGEASLIWAQLILVYAWNSSPMTDSFSVTGLKNMMLSDISSPN